LPLRLLSCSAHFCACASCAAQHPSEADARWAPARTAGTHELDLGCAADRALAEVPVATDSVAPGGHVSHGATRSGAMLHRVR
jgi:hypothetical protein